MPYSGLITRYRDYLTHLPNNAIPVTLLEGNTPLIPAPRLSAELGCDIRLKFEGLNPTGSFKDRGMTVAMTVAVAEGATACICASTGNTAASAAAYAARAGLACYVLIPQGKVAAGKLAGAVAYGATVIQVQGSFDDALAMVRELSQRRPIALVNSINPHRIEGQKTAAFELVDALGRAPDWLCLPVGNAGNITAYWKGFVEYHVAGRCANLPQLLGVQAEGAAPLVLGHAVEKPETVATAIRIGRPARGEEALQAVGESGGRILAVSDAEILEMQKRLAAEGVWCEPASAAGAAGLFKEVKAGRLDVRGKTIVCVITGHGLKDPDAITARFPAPRSIPATMSALEALIEG
ncbi:MAG: threonine synthase [Anaerolineales bacterium]|nr:threonine synthase [Anaerolineales bacterium]